ncbi:MAG: hypothetical protein U0904_04430 [Candidatus Nanopelagicales bacterium]|nr:hypothetical protein [Candidatus Nanopelagicales bacterium]
MGLRTVLFGRAKPVPPDLDALFALPSAAVTLRAALDFAPVGAGSVAFRAPEGRAFAEVEQDVRALLDADGGPKVESMRDDFGYTWLVVRGDPEDVAGLVTDLHAINSTLKDSGFGPTLLCSLVSFRDASGRQLAIVYLFKQGTFYPFAPQGPDKRDNVLELQVRDSVGSDLKWEPDLARWFAVWGAPGLGGS